ncbi:MAG: hypothetical protein JXB30_07545 [Anaerolineae bacterium]|nr:hypothetical protein [Anaerolineae bacterium]
MSDQNPYDAVDLAALTTLLLDPDKPPHVHRNALSALSRRSPFDRTSRLVTLLKSMVQHPGRYDQEVMMACIDILATDPDAQATLSMIESVPAVLGTAMDGSDALSPEFREYFYTALVSRQREGDLEVWAEFLPELDAKTLVAMVLDPAAHPLAALEPLVLIDRLPEPQRTKAFISVIAGIAHNRGPIEQATEAAEMIAKSSDPEQLKEGVAVLTQQWEKRKRAGKDVQLGILEATLRILDRKPRSAAERLSGKRPWAS